MRPNRTIFETWLVCVVVLKAVGIEAATACDESRRRQEPEGRRHWNGQEQLPNGISAVMKTQLNLFQGRLCFLLALGVLAGSSVRAAVNPTFSDANWLSLNPSLPGADDYVYAAAVDGSGNLYVGGAFAVIGNTPATYVAKWDGSRWTALGT